MSCKYCDLKRRKDEDGGYICPHGDGFRMLVYYDARCACTAVDNIKYCPFCGEELKAPKEPLIKDEQARKAIRAWAEANSLRCDDKVEARTPTVDCCVLGLTHGFTSIDVIVNEETSLKDYSRYTIAELCGEDD